MDYEKKYKEALERARKLYKDAITLQLEQDIKDYEYIFPELKESEDEIIRNRIIGYLKQDIEEHPERKERINEMLAWLEKQGEQKSVDKVEPKFSEGEWLCENELNNYARFIQILGIVNVQGKDRYRISRDIHKDEDVVEFGFVEKYYHKFDIQDAKDGDVLATVDNGSPFIYKGCLDPIHPDSPVAYCGIDRGECFCKCEFGYWWTDEKVQPATKEQRNLLFQKMREADYEWDAGKKELKKIKQNFIEPDDLIEESYQQQADDLISMVTENPAWSEEDEEMFVKIGEAINSYYAPFSNDAENMSNWLKSLKERMKGE